MYQCWRAHDAEPACVCISVGERTMLNLPGPRYLGAALAPGAVYMASLHETATEIVAFRGNMHEPEAFNSGKENRPPADVMTPSAAATPAQRFSPPKIASYPGIPCSSSISINIYLPSYTHS